MRLEYQYDIDRYLLNRMSDEERISFEDKCADNSEMKEQLEHTQDVKAVISERNQMLAKIQKWDEEYDEEVKASDNKKVWYYWISGIAAILITGFVLFPAISPESESSGGLVSINQEPQNKMTKENRTDSCIENKESEHLLAQTEKTKKEAREPIAKSQDEQVFSFGKSDLEVSKPAGQNESNHELRQIEEKISLVKNDIALLYQQLNNGDISQDFYDTSIGLLYYQRDCLRWRKAQILLGYGRRNEALDILKEMRGEKGSFQNRADSLYNELQ